MIGYFSHQHSGCYWYRIKRPMDALNEHGVSTFKIGLDQDIDDKIYNDITAVQVYGIFPFSFGRVLSKLKQEGKKIIYDLDDALDYIELTNPFYYSVKKDAASEREILQYADHITVSTPFIAEYIKQKTNVPVTVVPNCYNPQDWTFERPKKEGIRIGFAGSCTHIDDLLMVLPAIRNLQKKYDITFVLMGFGKEDYETWLHQFRFTSPPEGQKALDEFQAVMKDIKFEWIPYTDFENYPEALTNLALDLGLCPLKDTNFNKARSASKAMEYVLSGALALASNTEAYKHDPTSILVNDNEWEWKIEFQIIKIKSKTTLSMDKPMHLKWIKENRNINTQIDLLKSVYMV